VPGTDRNTPPPTELKLHRRSKELEIRFSDGFARSLSAEYLRVHSPSAEVKGHSAGEGMLVAGKQDVGIDRVEPVGRYAVRIVFDDGHATGLYTWPILYELCRERDAKWRRYLERLERAGETRAPRRAAETAVDERVSDDGE
jgi:DUF971 family protein